jgi:hypothetical protein
MLFCNSIDNRQNKMKSSVFGASALHLKSWHIGGLHSEGETDHQKGLKRTAKRYAVKALNANLAD